MPGSDWMVVKYAVIVSDELMEICVVPVRLSVSSGERDGARRRWGGKKIRPFAQKNNNFSSVRVTLRCGLLFAPSVTTGRSQRAVREALQMTMRRVWGG